MNKFSEIVTDAIFPSGLYLNLTSHDAEEMREQRAYWPFEHKQFGKGKFQGQLICVHTHRLQMSITHRSTGIFFRGGVPTGTSVISFPLTPCIQFYSHGKSLENNQVAALMPDDELEHHTSLPSSLLTIAVSSALLEHYAIALTGKPFAELRNQERLLIDQNSYKDITNHLVRLLELFNCHHFKCSDAQEKMFENQVLETILLGARPRKKVDKQLSRLTQAKKAENYIRDNLRNPLSISELCLATGTTERTLHLGFKERLGISPGAFIRIMRLNEIRQELRLSNSNKSVTEVAVNWGFYHLGRFAEQYSQMFGELPSQTKNI